MLSWEYPPHIVGGLGSHVAALVPALVNQGLEVYLITPRWAGGEPVETITSPQSGKAVIYRVDPPIARMGNFYADVQQTNLNLEEVGIRLIREVGVDLIHVHDWLVAFAGASLKRIRKIPLLTTIHATERGRNHGHLSTDMQHAINGTEWWLCYEAWRVITCSLYMAGQIMDFFNVPLDKIDVIPNGVDTQLFEHIVEGVDMAAFRSRFAAPDEKIVYHVGRLVHEKGPQLIVEAAPAVLAAYPKAKFVIAGRGPLLNELRDRAVAIGLADKFYFTGFLSDTDRNLLYKVADVAVFPSLYEPFGIVALEAMAARCPVVVASTGGLAEVVQHNQTGITVYPDSVESLAWGILHTLLNPHWAAARAENAYRVVQAHYNWDTIAKRTTRVYERIVEERARTEW